MKLREKSDDDEKPQAELTSRQDRTIMQTNRLLPPVICLFLVFGSVFSRGQESTRSNNGDGNQAQILNSLVGTWKGTCRTWLRPGQLANESKIKGEFKSILGGKLVRHTYESTIKGKPSRRFMSELPTLERT